MNIYERKSRWKVILVLIASLIIISTLWYTNRLAGKLAAEEKNRVEQIANIYKYISTASDNQDFGFLLEIIQSNKTVPIIWADADDNILDFRNIDSVKVQNDSMYLKKELKDMKAFADPVKFELSQGVYQYIYYKHSVLYTQLLYYPYVQLGIIAAFLIVAYILFNTARRSEQNRVWVGMAKETAHQLGTPISSLVAWIDYLRESGMDGKKNIVDEMQKDVERLELIAARFSKVGSSPDLVERNIVKELENTIDYLKRRSSKKVTFTFHSPRNEIKVKMNPTLFNWVTENLLKNALDAIEGSGDISVNIEEHGQVIYIDITDSGKGIPKSKFTTVFEPGYSTKKRGWGLGLTLAKRITENYHNGKIFVKSSLLGKGTTFRIILPKA